MSDEATKQHDNQHTKTPVSYCNLQHIRALGYFVCVAKETNLDATSFEQSLANRCTRCSKSDGFIIQLGFVLEGNWLPIWSQVATRFTKSRHKNRCKKTSTVWMASGLIFSLILTPGLPSRGGPRTHFWKLFEPWGPSWGQDDPDALPREHLGTDLK